MYKIKLSQKNVSAHPTFPIFNSDPYLFFCISILTQIDARRGGVEVAVWTVEKTTGFVSRHTLTACGPSDGTEVEDVFGRSGSVSG